MGVAVVQPLHGTVTHHTNDDGCHKEKHRVQQHLAKACARAGAGPQHTGQHHDADDIINDSGTDDGGPEKALQMAQLLQGGHCDGHAGGCHDGTDKECLIELRAAHGRKTVEQAVQQRTAAQRDRHAHTGDEGRNGAGPQQLFQIGAKARGKHQQHHADLRKDLNGIAGVHQVEQTGPDEQARDDLAYHLRRFAFAGHQPEKLGADHDDGEVPEDRIHGFNLLSHTFTPAGQPGRAPVEHHSSLPCRFLIITLLFVKIKTNFKNPAKRQLKIASCRFPYFYAKL